MVYGFYVSHWKCYCKSWLSGGFIPIIYLHIYDHFQLECHAVQMQLNIMVLVMSKTGSCKILFWAGYVKNIRGYIVSTGIAQMEKLSHPCSI